MAAVFALVACAEPGSGAEPARVPGAAQASGSAGAATDRREAAPATERASSNAPARARHELRADDGHPLVLWSRVPPSPRGAILLVHGRTWSARPDFDLQVPGAPVSLMHDLAGAELAAYAIDLRGYGDTPRDPSGWTTPDRAAADVLEALAWIGERHPGLPAPALFGWSNGAMVAQLVAQRAPAKISGLVLYGYPGGPGRRYADPEGEPGRVPTDAAGAASDFITPTVDPRVRAAFVETAVATDPVRADWKGLATWAELDPARVVVPTLLIHGEHDPYARPQAHAWLFAGLATGDRRWVVVPRGDHAVHLEADRDRFVRAVIDFVELALAAVDPS